MLIRRILNRLTGIPGIRSLWLQCPIGSIETRVRYEVFKRPHYAYGVYSAADLAKRLGLNAISVIEFGVAGGRGLLELESLAGVIGRHLGIRIHVVGFDSGEGMPAPVDYRDLPHVWQQGYYVMERNKLESRLSRSTELILGHVAETLPSWLKRQSADTPVGFIAFDLDYYSSTKEAFRLFNRENRALHLPRTYCYFDDIIDPERACHNEYTGELCAIREFNDEHPDQKICPIHGLHHTRVHRTQWTEQMYVLHDFGHPLYCKNISPTGAQHTGLPL